jgi:protein-disulfide isomerase
MDKRFWAIVGVILVVFIGFLVLRPDSNEDAKVNATPTNHIKGEANASVKLVEYGDFQCPYCGQYYPLVQQVTEKYKDNPEFSFQFLNLPLPQIHQNATAAARAAEAADKQGKYWEMYDKLFQNQSAWGSLGDARPTFRAYASELKLDMKQYDKDYASKAVNDKINADVAKFNKTKLEKSTPTFILNGKSVKPTSVDEFSKLIDAELKKAEAKTTEDKTTE